MLNGVTWHAYTLMCDKMSAQSYKCSPRQLATVYITFCHSIHFKGVTFSLYGIVLYTRLELQAYCPLAYPMNARRGYHRK